MKMVFKKQETRSYYDSLPGMLAAFDGYACRDRFCGGTLGELQSWQEQERKVLAELIGLDRLTGVKKAGESEARPMAKAKDPTAETETAAEANGPMTGAKDPTAGVWAETSRETLPDGITRIRVLFQVDEYAAMPMIVLEPAGEPRGTCLALAGHQGAGKESVAGVRDVKAVREKIDFFNYDYGLKMAGLGFVTICPDQRGFGERRDEACRGDDLLMSCSCRNLANMAIPMGLSVIGLCTYDYVRLLDHLEAYGRYDLNNLRCVGFSGGGMQALYLAALDERVKKVFISGYMYGVRDSLMILNSNCSCNYVPGLWEHLDMGDVASLIAPRPLLIQSCRDDHLNGIRGLDNVYEQMEILKKAYSLYGATEMLTHDVRPGEHHFHDEPLAEWAE